MLYMVEFDDGTTNHTMAKNNGGDLQRQGKAPAPMVPARREKKYPNQKRTTSLKPKESKPSP